jgi:hypothetical protein
MSAAATIMSPAPGSNPAGVPTRDPGFFSNLDRILRHREGFFDEIFEGKQIAARIRWFLFAIVTLSGLYGVTMGASAFMDDWRRGLLQMLTSAAKVPSLYVLSVVVSYPVLYIVIVLMGSRLRFSQTLSLILLALTLNSVLLASCAPIVLFFVFTGSNYAFIKLLHVVIFAFSGCWAMMALWQGLRTMCEKSDLYPRQAIRILQVWILVFGFVGTQMAWSLRPFVGSPDLNYQLFRKEQPGNLYQAVWSSVLDLGKKAMAGK